VVLLVIGVGLGIGAKVVIERMMEQRGGGGVMNVNAGSGTGAGDAKPPTNGLIETNPLANANANTAQNQNTASNANTNTSNGNANQNTNSGSGARSGRVTASKVTVRDSPSIRGSAIGLLDSSERVEILDESENTSANEGVIARDAPFKGDGAGTPSSLPSGRGVIVLRDAGDSYYVETTDRGRTIRGYVFKRDVTSGTKLWYRVRSASGKSGWVNSQFVAVDP
jgi:hypothetical protein